MGNRVERFFRAWPMCCSRTRKMSGSAEPQIEFTIEFPIDLLRTPLVCLSSEIAVHLTEVASNIQFELLNETVPKALLHEYVFG